MPLSPLGERRADAVGRWSGALSAAEAPTLLLCSSCLRARQTTQRLAAAAHWRLPDEAGVVDERLREREFGILDRLTIAGIAATQPALAEQRAHVGKFYLRPPGGESWCDVMPRLMDELACGPASR